MEMKTKIIAGLSISLILFFGMWFYLAQPKSQTPLTPQPVVKDVEPTLVAKNGDYATVAHGECLEDDEVADYIIDKKEKSAHVLVKKTTNIKTTSIKVDGIIPTHYHLIELHKCGVYFIHEINYDVNKRRSTPGYKNELFIRSYNGASRAIMTFSETDQFGNYKLFHDDDFRIDPKEKYLALTTGYLGSPDFALVIKNLKTLKDVFTLPFADILAKNPSLEGDIAFNEWTEDGGYFWANIFGGAPIIGFIRIDTTNWTYELFPAPQDMLGGDALNVSTGDVTVHPGNEWSGVSQIDDEEKAARRTKGIGTDLYIYNLFTKKRTLVSHTDEPLAYFHPRWISSTTLEYFMPKPDGSTGEQKEFVVKKQ